MPIKPLSIGSSAMMCSRLVSTTRPIATLFISRMVSRMTAKASWPTLPSGTQVVGTDQIARIDLAAVDELVDLDGARRFQRDVLELLLRHLDEGVGVDLVALDDVLVGDLLAGIGVHLGVLDAVAGLPVELVERDLFGLRRGRIQRDRTGDERKAQEAFPVGAGGHGGELQLLMPDLRRTRDLGSDSFAPPSGSFFSA